jgi:hypothetical protein
MTIIVDQHGTPALQIIFMRRDPEPVETSVLQHFLLGNPGLNIVWLVRSNDLRWWMTVIKQGIIVGKTFCTE